MKRDADASRGTAEPPADEDGPPTTTGAAATAEAAASLPEGVHPDRYAVREKEDERYLCCVEAPEVGVTFDSAAVAQDATARKAPPGTIFVDGAAQAPPFVDAEREVFNLDHHVGCVRQFTLASCEQALVLVLRGLDLGKRPWTIRAAEPDLDAVLAIWVLLNATHLQAPGSTARRRLIPLVRLESVIDVHGLGLAELSGLPPRELEAARKALEDLRRHELELKRSGEWSSTDFGEYTAAVLRRIDGLAFPPGSLPQPVPFEVLARETLRGESLVLVCRADDGVYEVESGLKQAYGRRLGILALETAPGRFTLRLVDPFQGGDLEAVYEELNAIDPAVAGGGWRYCWGGSGEIGGSPRQSPTQLRPREIAEACQRALRRRTPLRRIAAIGGAVVVAATGLLGGFAASWQMTGSVAPPPEGFPFSIGFGAVAVALLLAFGLRRPRAFGLQPLVLGDWLYCLPVALAVALAGGAWRIAPPLGLETSQRAAMVALLAVGAEALFRGVAHGTLNRSFRVSHAGGRWFLSVPGAVGALLYAGAGLLLPLAGPPLLAGSPAAEWIGRAAAALLFGLTVGLARERSGSVLAPALLHLLGVGVCLLLT